jgi:hypothetical protein
VSDGQVSRNQGNDLIIIQESNLRAYSACCVCPNCGKFGFSNSVQKYNWKNTLFCLVMPCFWFCHQINNKKDLNCYDAQHNCVGCNHQLADYSAC